MTGSQPPRALRKALQAAAPPEALLPVQIDCLAQIPISLGLGKNGLTQ